MTKDSDLLPASAPTSKHPNRGSRTKSKKAVSLRAKLEEIGTAAFSVAGMVGAQLESDRIAEGVRRLAEETVDAVLQAARYEVERALSP